MNNKLKYINGECIEKIETFEPTEYEYLIYIDQKIKRFLRKDIHLKGFISYDDYYTFESFMYIPKIIDLDQFLRNNKEYFFNEKENKIFRKHLIIFHFVSGSKELKYFENEEEFKRFIHERYIFKQLSKMSFY